jgi:phage gp36-like protein
MIEQEFIMLIMNCKKYEYKATYQKNTWLQNIPEYIKYYHVLPLEKVEPNLEKVDLEKVDLALPFLKVEKVEEEYKFDNEKNILYVNCEDDYNSLPKKVISAYNAIHETFNYKYIFKTDDDQNLINLGFLNVISNLINKKIPKSHYGGNIIDVKENYLSQYSKIHSELPDYLPILKTKYCSGRFYFLSKNAISNLINKRENINKEFLEDYAIGFHLDNYYKENIIHIDTDNFFKDIIFSL